MSQIRLKYRDSETGSKYVQRHESVHDFNISFSERETDLPFSRIYNMDFFAKIGRGEICNIFWQKEVEGKLSQGNFKQGKAQVPLKNWFGYQKEDSLTSIFRRFLLISGMKSLKKV